MDIKGPAAIAQKLYLTDKRIKRKATIVVGQPEPVGGTLIIYVCANYKRGKRVAKRMCNDHKEDFTAFDFSRYPDIKHGTFQYRDSVNS
jgi:hypothetical protein